MEVMRLNSTCLGEHTRTRGVLAVVVVVAVEEVTPTVVEGAVAGGATTIRMVAISTMTLGIIIQETTTIREEGAAVADLVVQQTCTTIMGWQGMAMLAQVLSQLSRRLLMNFSVRDFC